MSIEEQLTLSQEDLATRFWAHDPTHLGFAMTPLFQSIMLPAIAHALNNWDQSNGHPSGTHQPRVYHGYAYNEVVDPPMSETPPRTALEAMRPKFQNIAREFSRLVESELLPTYDELDRLQSKIDTRDDAQTALATLVRVYDRIMHLHMMVIRPVYASEALYEMVFLELFPNKTAREAHNLLIGASNQFVETDRALALLAESIRNVPTVRQALEAPHPMDALSRIPEAHDFLHDLSILLDRYGWRVGTGHDFIQKTWREDPEPALLLVRQFLAMDPPFETRWQQIRTQQQQAYAETLEDLRPEDVERFHDVFEIAYSTKPLDENHHFYIDAMLPAKSRGLLLRIGEVLESAGLLGSPDQIFFLYRDELENLLSGATHIDPALLELRRAQHHDYYRETPPSTLGTPKKTPPAPSQDEGDSVLRGIAASTGIWEGTVRVVQGMNDFAQVKNGDVLVARTTNPSWSGLFSIAGAIVTDSGGMLCHAATVAREYQVPCVVATRHATSRLHNGDRVRVEGHLGTVTIITRSEP